MSKIKLTVLWLMLLVPSLAMVYVGYLANLYALGVNGGDQITGFIVMFIGLAFAVVATGYYYECITANRQPRMYKGRAKF